jgi:hypothetical protein
MTEEILGKEGDIDDVLLGLDDGCENLKSHKTRNRAENEIEFRDEIFHGPRPGEVLLDGRDALLFFQPLERLRIDIRDGNVEKRIRGQIDSHRPSDEAGSKDDDLHVVLLQ